MGVRIIEAIDTTDVAHAATLFREYAAGLPFSLCFQGFDQELATLPGRYGPPRGRIFLALNGTMPIGCIALREIAPATCEMKRMYVKPSHRGRGVGRLLAERLIRAAREIGYAEMRLDSEDTMTAAVTLYRSLGFINTDRYNDDPHPHTIWMKLDLSNPGVPNSGVNYGPPGV